MSEKEHPAVARLRAKEERRRAQAEADTDADGEGDGDGDGDGGGKFRQLRQRAAQADALEAENRRLRTDVALRDAGLALTETQRAALLAVHEGEIDPDAFRETATALQFVEPPQVPFEEQAAYQRMAEATAGADASEAYPRTLIDEMSEAKTPEQLAAILEREGLLHTE